MYPCFDLACRKVRYYSKRRPTSQRRLAAPFEVFTPPVGVLVRNVGTRLWKCSQAADGQCSPGLIGKSRLWLGFSSVRATLKEVVVIIFWRHCVKVDYQALKNRCERKLPGRDLLSVMLHRWRRRVIIFFRSLSSFCSVSYYCTCSKRAYIVIISWHYSSSCARKSMYVKIWSLLTSIGTCRFHCSKPGSASCIRAWWDTSYATALAEVSRHLAVHANVHIHDLYVLWKLELFMYWNHRTWTYYMHQCCSRLPGTGSHPVRHMVQWTTPAWLCASAVVFLEAHRLGKVRTCVTEGTITEFV